MESVNNSAASAPKLRHQQPSLCCISYWSDLKKNPMAFWVQLHRVQHVMIKLQGQIWTWMEYLKKKKVVGF